MDKLQMVVDSNAAQKETLENIRLFLRDHKTEEYTCIQLADKVGLSRITVRRYMNYLLTRDEIVSCVDYLTGGRPAIKYRLR